MAISAAGAERLYHDALTTDATAVVIVQDGDVIWEHRHPDHEDLLVNTASVTKFAVGRCVAHAVFVGAIESIDTPACLWLAEWKDDERSAITLRHLMRHTSGLPAAWDGGEGHASLTAEAVALLPVAAPGTMIAYNNHGAQLVAEVVRRATGKPIDEYAASAIFEPLGIVEWRWNSGPDGLPYGMSALQLRPRDLARIGELALSDGTWGSQQIHGSGWGAESRRPGMELGLLEMIVGSHDIALDLTDCAALDPALEAAVRGLDGQTMPLNGTRSLFAQLAAHLPGAEVAAAFQRLRAAAPSLRFIPADHHAYGHSGSGGQHLWVIPAANAVAVRMRRFDERTDDPRTTSLFAEVALDALS